MVRRIKIISSPSEERYRRNVEQELAKFEKREREFVARERRQRAAELGLPVFERRPGERRLGLAPRD